jgi:large subunit ribosomal protein L25
MDTTIEVVPRTGTGKGLNRKTRARGVVPAVVYGKEREPRVVEVDPVKLVDLFKSTRNRNTILSLRIGQDAPIPCLVREVQRHPVSRAIRHVDFYAVPSDTPLEVMVPLRPLGRPKGALLGGRLQVVRRELRVACRYDRIPEFIDLDVSPLDVGGEVRASQMTMPEGVSLVSKGDYLVVRVLGKVQAVAEEAKPAAAAEEKKE